MIGQLTTDLSRLIDAKSYQPVVSLTKQKPYAQSVAHKHFKFSWLRRYESDNVIDGSAWYLIIGGNFGM